MGTPIFKRLVFSLTKLNGYDMSDITPPVIAENLELLKSLNPAEVAMIINLRAGRLPELDVQANAIINQFNLIESELLEGKLAASLGDLDGVRDAIADIMLLAMGQQGIIGNINVDADYRLMCAYNLTRIPKSMLEAERTVAKYSAIGIKTEIHKVELNLPELNFVETVFAVRCINEDQWDIRGDHYPPNKFVKSVDFHDANYPKLEGVTIIRNKDSAEKVGSLFTKEMSRKITNMLVENHGKYGTAPMKDLINFFAELTGKRF